MNGTIFLAGLAGCTSRASSFLQNPLFDYCIFCNLHCFHSSLLVKSKAVFDVFSVPELEWKGSVVCPFYRLPEDAKK